MRLDNYLVNIGLFDSRTKAKQAIERKEIFINSKCIDKSSYLIDENLQYVVEKKALKQFVSLGGYKLDKALDDFNYSVENHVVADIGASTGGFTDCLLQRGASKVYCIDVNDYLLHDSLRKNKKVVSIIKNARDLTIDDLPEKIDTIVADLSFISVTYVLKQLSDILTDGKSIIILIKPQFETGTRKKYKNGIIRDSIIHKEICNNIIEFSKKCALSPVDFTVAPLNKDKNTEFLIRFIKGRTNFTTDFKLSF